MKHNLFRLTALLVILSFGVACGAPAAPPPVSSPGPAPAETAEETVEAGETMPAETPAVPVTGEIDCMGAQQGDRVTMLYQWSGAEEENLNRILQPLVDECGIVLAPESTRDQALLDTRVQAGTPPDIVFWGTSQLVQYQDRLQDLGELGAHQENYPDFWIETGTLEDRWLGVPVKADVKSIIWYSPVEFEAAGYEVPTTWDDLSALVEQMVSDGRVPWSMGFESGDATGWAGSDFIQDILLVRQGPDYVMGIVDGSVPYDDAGVQEAYQIYGTWARDPMYTVGGAQGTLSTGFLDAIYKVFSDPPEAMMVKQSGFAGGAIQDQFPDLEYGTDFDFFQVPEVQGLQGGADYLMAFNDTPAVRALVVYITSELGAATWAETGFDLSPNEAAAGNYPEPGLAKRGEMLAGATAFTPDIGDSIPGGFANAEWKAIVDYVNGADLNAVLDPVASAQAQGVQPR